MAQVHILWNVVYVHARGIHPIALTGHCWCCCWYAGYATCPLFRFLADPVLSRRDESVCYRWRYAQIRVIRCFSKVSSFIHDTRDRANRKSSSSVEFWGYSFQYSPPPTVLSSSKRRACIYHKDVFWAKPSAEALESFSDRPYWTFKHL